MARLVAGSALLLDASLFQGFARPGLEAMACGVPAVLTSEGGINEYARDGVNCLQALHEFPLTEASASLRRRLHVGTPDELLWLL